jgi:hypothetical protein
LGLPRFTQQRPLVPLSLCVAKPSTMSTGHLSCKVS